MGASEGKKGRDLVDDDLAGLGRLEDHVAHRVLVAKGLILDNSLVSNTEILRLKRKAMRAARKGKSRWERRCRRFEKKGEAGHTI
jgi:hypothetical protein